MSKILCRSHYKAVTPEETINNIKNILSATLNLTTVERCQQDSNYYFHSSRVSFPELPHSVGTNGKGMTYQYSLASAYGELMERMQNNILFPMQPFTTPFFRKYIEQFIPSFSRFLIRNNMAQNYNYAPDEKNSIEIHDYHMDNISDVLGASDIYLPFYSIKDAAAVYLPITKIRAQCTSNGMCAGNTPQEAILQGICEIIERFAIKQFFKEKIIPATIDKELFKGTTIYEYILNLEKINNWRLEIKDCSCGIGLPAIGLLIIDRNTSRYHFHVGSDPSPITALERTLTELFQGRTTLPFKDFDPIYQDRLYNNLDLSMSESQKTYHDNTGVFPYSVLCSSKVQNYSLEDNDMSDKENLKKIIKLISDLGYNIYIRDVSFLGFPAFHIYIPGMSEIYSTNNIITKSDSLKALLLSIEPNKLSNENYDFLHSYLSIKDSINGLQILGNEIMSDYDIAYAYFSIAIGKYSSAFEYLNHWINNNAECNIKYKCMRDVIYYDYINRTSDSSHIYKLYDKELILKVKSSLRSRTIDDLIKYSCKLNCEKCSNINECSTLMQFRIVKRIETIYEQNIIDQTIVREYL